MPTSGVLPEYRGKMAQTKGQPPATMRKDDIQLLYEYAHWAKNRILQAVSALTAEQFARDLGRQLSLRRRSRPIAPPS
jgi:hypothetical protein